MNLDALAKYFAANQTAVRPASPANKISPTLLLEAYLACRPHEIGLNPKKDIFRRVMIRRDHQELCGFSLVQLEPALRLVQVYREDKGAAKKASAIGACRFLYHHPDFGRPVPKVALISWENADRYVSSSTPVGHQYRVHIMHLNYVPYGTHFKKEGHLECVCSEQDLLKAFRKAS